jgi:nucleoid DNA-binding protein
MSVTFSKLAIRVLEDLEKLNDDPKFKQQEILALMHRVFYHIGDALASGEDVYLEGFGRFYPDCKPPRKVKSNLTEEEHVTDFKVFVRFNSFKQLNSRVQNFLESFGLKSEGE